MLEDEGVFNYSPQAGPYGTAGVHDTVGILCGLFFSVECKADASKKMTALQERFWEKVEEAGGKCFLVYDKETIEQVREWIVSTRNRRSEGTDGGVGEPTGHSRCDPYSSASFVEAYLDTSASHFGEYPSLEELGPRYT